MQKDNKVGYNLILPRRGLGNVANLWHYNWEVRFNLHKTFGMFVAVHSLPSLCFCALQKYLDIAQCNMLEQSFEPPILALAEKVWLVGGRLC